jgi:hypothetical protein
VLLRLAAAAVVLVLAGCGGGSKQAATTTQPGSDLPPGCSVDEVNRIVTDFLAHPSLAPPGQFQVYADYPSDKRSFVSRTRAKALAHLRRRLALGERNRLIQLRVSAHDFNHVRITYELTRYAPDFRSRGIHFRLVNGAGTVDCAHQKIAAWVSKGP